jgi:glycosyltransferase involved in cell wall biosynthesis
MTRKNDKPLVSVIIPVYNGAKFIGSAIESAREQTYTNLEIIVVDDGSTDETHSIIETHAAKDSRVRGIRQANGGVAKARNLAVAETRGEFVAPLDADDLWLPNKIERQVRQMLNAGDDTGLVYSWWASIDENGKVLDRSPRWMIEGNVLETLIIINFTGNASVPLFRKHCLEEAGGYNEKLAASNAGGCEDWEAVLRVAAHYRLAVVPDILVGYRRQPGSMSTAGDTMWRSQQMVMQGMRELRPDLNPALYRGSENQFRMYLAGVSFWSGSFTQALSRVLNAGIRLPILVSPWVLKMLLLGPRRNTTEPVVMVPGKSVDTSRIPDPLLPYDLALSPLQLPGRIFWALTRPIKDLVAHTLHSYFLTREYTSSSIHSFFRKRSKRTALSGSPSAAIQKPKVLAVAGWHFPVYSNTFVYREVAALAQNGFDVRFSYAGLLPRNQLPDDLGFLWRMKNKIFYADVIGARDFRHYKRSNPAKVNQILKAICETSGMSEQEVLAHRHFKQAFTFTRFAEAWKPDYIHTYFFYEATLFGYVASTLLDIPRGVSCYADHMVDDYDLKLVELHLSTCDVVVATSARIKQELEEIAERPLPTAIVKPNGVDASQFTAAERPPSGPARVMRAVAVNRIHPKKGLTYLVEAALLLRDRGIPFSMDILGEYDAHDSRGSAYDDQLKKFVAQHELESVVIFRGRQTAAEVRRHLAEKDIFVAPFVELSNGDKDGIPTALLEAMAAGCAIVTTNSGSISEVVRDGVEGLVVTQRDSLALADAIARLAADDTLRARLSHAAVYRARTEFDLGHWESTFHERVLSSIREEHLAGTDSGPPSQPGIQFGGDRALKIALLSFEYPPETGFGGIGTYTWYHARALARLGHQVHVLAGATEPCALSTSEHDGVFVHRYRADDFAMACAGLFGKLRYFWTRQRIQNAWCMYRGLKLLMKKHRFDVLEMPECGAEGALVTHLIDTPAVVRLHSPSQLIMPFYDVPRTDIVCCSWIEKHAIHQAKALTSPSAFLATEVRNRMSVDRRIAIIPNGIDLPLFDREPIADIHSLYRIPDGQITILFAGRMERRKGIHLCQAIVEMVLSRRDVTFLFAGEDLFGYLEGIMLPALATKKLLGSVRYLGKLSLQELRACARAVDIFLLPSLWENLPYSCLEAMASSRAIVCSDQGGLPELIQNGVNGLLAKPESPQSFAAQLETLIDNPALRQTLGAAARRTVEQSYTDTHAAVLADALYRECIGRIQVPS